MSWHFVERWLQKVNQHSTLLGKFWITFLIVFRIVVVSSVGDRVYADEQSEFKCNTQEVGCPNVCFNKFSPISHIRFWSFQIILVATPSIAFIVYSAHQVKKRPLLAKQKPGISTQSASPVRNADLSKDGFSAADDKKRNSKMSASKSGPANRNSPNAAEFNQKVIKELFGEDKSAFSQHYILYTLSVILRTGVEVVFMYLQYDLFGFNIVELYKCEVKPCPNVVDCFVSRPMEKTIFLWFMFIITVLCLVLNAIELVYLFWKLCVKRPRIIRHQKRLLYMGPIEGPNKISKVGTNCSLSERPNIQIPSAPPIYGKVVNLPEFGKDHSRRSTAQDLGEPMAMSFNINDAVLHEEASNGGNKYLATLLSSPSISNYCRANDNIQEQVFLNHPQTNSANQVKNFNNYV